MRRRGSDTRDFVFHPSASAYNGSNTYATRAADLTGIADGKQFIFSTWIRLSGGDGAQQVLFSISDGTASFQVARATTNRFQMVLRNAAGTLLANASSTSTFVAGATWRHVLISADTAVASGLRMYITDVLENTTTPTNDTIDFTRGQVSYGGTIAGASVVNGCLSETFFHTSYLDLTQTANRRKFISATGQPVPLGDGSLPLGVAPLVYAPNGNLAVNRGTGGNFTVNGTVGNCTSRP